ncbi:hypothetical protein GGR54DRAFT_609055 [Hypoxylon sp. NC1633]|nr:hypothetical protein GGR54DRAFT_609055 [Hypoxylon sp. NC1633]
MATQGCVTTVIKYLKPLALYQTEKPFKIAFDVSEIAEAQKTNHEFVDHHISVTDVRGTEDQFTLDKNGFQFCKLPTSLRKDDFDSDEIVRSQLYSEVKELVGGLMPQGTEVVILGHKRRERRPGFPAVVAYSIPLPHPVVYAHADFTSDGAAIRLEPVWNERPDLRGRRFQMVNVWRVTKGPNQDWPLACCDYQSIDVDNDIEQSDVIHRTHIGENCMLLPNSSHKWYYLDNQGVDEVIVFRHCDSLGLGIPFSPHVSFDRAMQLKDVPLRESIEVKVVCFLCN